MDKMIGAARVRRKGSEKARYHERNQLCVIPLNIKQYIQVYKRNVMLQISQLIAKNMVTKYILTK